MKAAQISKYGGPEVIIVSEDVQTPQMKGGQILVENYAASINPADTKFREGAYKDMNNQELPITIGGDFAGHVKALGPSVAGYSVGDIVYGYASVLNNGSGSMAEKLTGYATAMAIAPKELLSIEETAAYPLAGVSAIQGLEEHLQLKPEQKILIHGGSGGIGHIAIQLAKALGAYVITTVSTDNVEFVTSLGADEVIDYKNADFVDMVKELDAVFDTVGGDVATRSLKVLKQGGQLVSMVGGPTEDEAKEAGVTVISQLTQVNKARLNRLGTYISAGKIKAAVNKTFTLDECQDAFRYAEQNSVQGKVVVRVR